MNTTLHVEIVCAGPDVVWQRMLTLKAGATVADALAIGGVPQALPPWARGDDLAVGIYGRVVPLTEPLRTGDRVELYRPLHFDPKESRRRRAAHRQTQPRKQQRTQQQTQQQTQVHAPKPQDEGTCHERPGPV